MSNKEEIFPLYLALPKVILNKLLLDLFAYNV
jgi:hypothetical protein